MIIHKQPIHEEHSEVQELIEAGYNKNESITAIERWGTAEEAMEHLLVVAESDGIFVPTAPEQAKETPAQYPTNVLVNSLLFLLVTYFMCGMCINVHRGKQITIFVDPDAEKKYLMLEELGCVLRKLSVLPSTYACRIYLSTSYRVCTSLTSHSCCVIQEKLP